MAKIGHTCFSARFREIPHPSINKNSRVRAIPAERGSRLKNRGMDKTKAHKNLMAGFRRESSGEREAGLSFSLLSFAPFTFMSQSSLSPMVKTLSARNSMSSLSWVTATTATPLSATERISITISSQVDRSWPKVGSSRIKTSGEEAREEATVSLRFSPPDKV